MVRSQLTGRHLIRSERNIRPAVRVKVPAAGQDLDLYQHANASVLCNPSVLSKPHSIIKNTIFEGNELSRQSPQHTSSAALSVLALKLTGTGLQASNQPCIQPGTPLSTRGMRCSPIISTIDMWGLEHFEKESIREYQKLKRGSVFWNEVFSLDTIRAALPKTYKKTNPEDP